MGAEGEHAQQDIGVRARRQLAKLGAATAARLLARSNLKSTGLTQNLGQL